MKKISLPVSDRSLCGLCLRILQRRSRRKVVPPDVESVAGIEPRLFAPGPARIPRNNARRVAFERQRTGRTTKWNIDYKIVGTEKALSTSAASWADFKGYFKASSSTGAKIVEFSSASPRPTTEGLLLLSETSEGFDALVPRLDVMETPVSPSAFKDNNPTLLAGKDSAGALLEGRRHHLAECGVADRRRTKW